MRRANGFLLIVTSAAIVGCAPHNDGPAPVAEQRDWPDESPHESRYVAAGDVRLHYLDWGGTGAPLVFLPGLGSSAHAFDDIAPRLTDRFRVLAMTPRAHGASSAPDTTYTVAQSAADLLLLLDSLGIERAHLAAHSIAGSTITRFAAVHPERVGKLVYLDATFDYGGADEEAVDRIALPRPWPEGGMASIAEYREWARRYFFGTWTSALEADARAGDPDGEDAERRRKARAALLDDVIAYPKEYAAVDAPALALWAQKTMDSHYFWVDRDDADAHAQALEYLRLRRDWERSGVDRFRWEMRNGRVIEFPGHHWLFVTDQDRVLGEMRAFLLDGGSG